MPLQVELVSPEGVVYAGEAATVIARTPSGELAFKPGHVPFVGTLWGTGPVQILKEDGTVVLVAAHSGFVQVVGDVVSILSDVAELPAEIDVPRAEAARDRARVVLGSEGGDEEAKAALRRAELRLRVALAGVGSGR